MKTYLLALVLTALGGFLIYEAWRAQHTFSGAVDYYGKGIAYQIDGRYRLPEYVIYYASGGVFIAAGAMLLVHDLKSAKRPRKKRR